MKKEALTFLKKKVETRLEELSGLLDCINEDFIAD